MLDKVLFKEFEYKIQSTYKTIEITSNAFLANVFGIQNTTDYKIKCMFIVMPNNVSPYRQIFRRGRQVKN